MTFDDIVRRVADRLNLTSDDAIERIGWRVNEVYKDVTSSIGLEVARRVDTNLVVDPDDPDFSDLPLLTLTGIEKVLRVNLVVPNSRPKTLDESFYDDIANQTVVRQNPQTWATKRMGANSVTIILDAYPEDEFTLAIEGYETADELADDAEPAFAESFHDVLMEGAIAEELRKMEKPQLAVLAMQKYEKRLSDLRMFIAKSAYMDIYQGKQRYNRASILNRNGSGWWRF